MLSFFDAMTPWARNDGSLHVYALPEEEVADRLEGLSVRLDDLDSLPRMPRAWLHATVARLAQFDDLGQAGLSRLCDELGSEVERVPAFEVRLGAPEVTGTAVTCTGEATRAWASLVGAVAAAASRFSDDPLPPAPHAPHVSLGYATGQVDDDEVRARLAGAPAAGAFPVREVHLVSVTVRPELGTFDWTELASWQLG